jgi:hypothetical protein
MVDDNRESEKEKLLKSVGFACDSKSHSWFKSGKMMVSADKFEDSSLKAIKDACERYEKTGNWELEVD